MGVPVFFDINETTLDLSGLKAPFESLFGSPWALPEWFGRVLQASHVCAMTGVDTGFRELAAAGLERSAGLFGVALSPETRDQLLSGFASLPAHPDVAPALERLRGAGFHPVAFSNSSSTLLEAQLRSAGLIDAFETFISVQEVMSFKPHFAVYHHASTKMGFEPEQCWMVAAHDWDIHGAQAAGMKGAYLARHTLIYQPAYLPPRVRADTMPELVDAILADG